MVRRDDDRVDVTEREEAARRGAERDTRLGVDRETVLRLPEERETLDREEELPAERLRACNSRTGRRIRANVRTVGKTRCFFDFVSVVMTAGTSSQVRWLVCTSSPNNEASFRSGMATAGFLNGAVQIAATNNVSL